MAIRAVVFDVGGVLEEVGDLDSWLESWRHRLGPEPSDFDERMAQIDPQELIGTGDLSEVDYRQRYVDAFGMGETDADVFMADMWDWYCGELDVVLCAYAAALRPAYQTAILSNSADGARREEQRRYGFEQLVDTIVYSHEVGLVKPDPRIYQLTCERLGVEPDEMVFLDNSEEIVQSARQFGIHALHHRHTPDSIAAINALLAVHSDPSGQVAAVHRSPTPQPVSQVASPPFPQSSDLGFCLRHGDVGDTPRAHDPGISGGGTS